MKKLMLVCVLIGLFKVLFGARVDILLDEPNTWYYSLLIGDGRNDDTNRIYLLSLHSFGDTIYFSIRELSFSRGEWNADTVCTLYEIGIGRFLKQSMCLADVRNDGLNRLYVSTGNSILEFTYINGEWKDTEEFQKDIGSVS